MTCCSANNCKNRTEQGFRMYRFPSPKNKRYGKWLHNIRRGESWIPSSHSRLCEKHFEQSQFESHRKDGLIKLKPNAIPTLFDVPNPHPSNNPPQRKSVYKNVSVKNPLVGVKNTSQKPPITAKILTTEVTEASQSETYLQLEKTTQEQFQKMLEFVKNNEIVLRAKGTLADVQTRRNLWQEFAADVNSLDNGSKNSAKQWRHMFNEWKKNVKRKRRQLLPSKVGEQLSELEMGLLQLLNFDIQHNKTQDVPILLSAASNTSTCSEQIRQCNNKFSGSSSYETSDNLQSRLNTVKIEVVDEMVPPEDWLYLPKEEVEDRPASSSLKEASEQTLGIKLEHASTESLNVLNSALTALVEVQKERAAIKKKRATTEKGKLKLKYFQTHKTFQGFDEFYFDL